MSIPIKQKNRSITRSRSEALDSVLTFLFLAENKDSWDWIAPLCDEPYHAKTVEAFNRIQLSHFDGADVSLLYESLMGTTSYERKFCTEIDELRRLPAEKWDNSSALYMPERAQSWADEENKTGYLLTLMRIRYVPLKLVRGLFKLRGGPVIELATADVFNDGSYSSNREYLQFFGQAWHTVGVPIAIDPPFRHSEEDSRSIWLDRSMAMTKEYDWSVHIGFNIKSLPAVSIPSDPIGARGVFKLRDVPPGKNRREALRHWVSGHTRMAVQAPDYAERYIWPYLRGAEQFTWNGLFCKIQPSEFDLRKAKEYQLMRQKGVRV